VDPDPVFESGSGSRRAKTTDKKKKFHVLKCDVLCSLDFLIGGLGIGKL
jgi:hypothetical protein